MFKKARWQQSKAWVKFLNAYDGYVEKHMGDAEVLDLESRFGSTRVYKLGDPKNPPLFLMHGFRENSLAFADWLIPHLKKDFQVFAIDRLGEKGRSLPKDGLHENIPQGEKNFCEWFLTVKSGLNLKGTPISMFGHSYGSLISAFLATKLPDEVDKLVLTAPAAVFAPQPVSDTQWKIQNYTPDFLVRICPTDKMKEGLMLKVFTAAFKEDYSKYPYWEVLGKSFLITENISTIPLGIPFAFSIDELRKMNDNNPSFLMIGDLEIATRPEESTANAKAARIPFKVYIGSGHEIWFPNNADSIVKDTIDFLHGKKVDGATYH